MNHSQSTIKMTSHFMSAQVILGTCLTIAVLSCGMITVQADDEVPAFFLKIAKNVPRIGRSDKYHEYFLKQAKNVPRMGKREDYDQIAESFYNNREPFAQRQKRMVSHASAGGLDSSTWGHFPLAIEGPPELWRALASYASDRYGTSSVNEINNDLWSRDKRSPPPSP
ncbi:uncharacterized protein LOC107040000 [Diachasma alloeum]|uniref:uncharacterized protein LOC107040000 n=1 Tax=Diachasma alloeum TaxID=454923 RepID=UPI0007384105|nr:uncharacterized protein LOC107040000 [Diachasma alloeum]